MKRITLVVMAAACIVGYNATPAFAHPSNKHVITLVDKRVAHTELFRAIAGHNPIKYWGAANRCHHRGCYALNVVRLHRWTLRDIRARASMHPYSPLIMADMMCLHQHEGAWNDATGNGYYGGLQFLPSTWFSTVHTFHLNFTSLPNLLRPDSQMIVAYDRYMEDGGSWREWSTAAVCGLS